MKLLVVAVLLCSVSAALVSAGSAGTYTYWMPDTTFTPGVPETLHLYPSDQVNNDGIGVSLTSSQGSVVPSAIVMYPDGTQSQPIVFTPDVGPTTAVISWAPVTLPLCSLNDLDPTNIAVQFFPASDGDDAYVSSVYSGTVNLNAATSGAISISFWLKRKSAGGTRSGVLSHGDDFTASAGGVMWVAFENNEFGIDTNDGSPLHGSETAYDSTDYWTYFTAQVSNAGAGVTDLWVNGAQRLSAAHGGSLHDSALLTIGCSVTADASDRGGCADMFLDSLRIYNSYLSGSQILDAFLRNMYSNVPTPQVFYAMDTDGTYLLDSSGNSNNLIHTVVRGGDLPPSHDVLTTPLCSLWDRTTDDHTWHSGSMTLTAPSTVTQDPRFVGFRGQEYQVHGIPNQFYALFSTPTLHFNALFSFLPFKVCDNKKFQQVQCVSHDGTYLTAFGFMTHTTQKERKRDLTYGPVASLKVAVPTGDSATTDLQVTYQDPAGNSQPLLVNTTHVFEMTRGEYVEKATFEKRRTVMTSMGAFEKTLTARSEALTDPAGDSFNASSQLISTEETRAKVVMDRLEQVASQIAHPYGSRVWIEFHSGSELTIHTSSATAHLILADGFINHEVALSNLQDYIRAEELAAEEIANGEQPSEVDVFSLPGAVANAEEAGVSSKVPRIHGLLGQTVLSKRYNNKWRYIQGDVSDYVVSDLFALDFNYAVFNNGTRTTPHH